MLKKSRQILSYSIVQDFLNILYIKSDKIIFLMFFLLLSNVKWIDRSYLVVAARGMISWYLNHEAGSRHRLVYLRTLHPPYQIRWPSVYPPFHLKVLGASEVSANLYCNSRTSVLGRSGDYLRLLMKRSVDPVKVMIITF